MEVRRASRRTSGVGGSEKQDGCEVPSRIPDPAPRLQGSVRQTGIERSSEAGDRVATGRALGKHENPTDDPWRPGSFARQELTGDSNLPIELSEQILNVNDA